VAKYAKKKVSRSKITLRKTKKINRKLTFKGRIEKGAIYVVVFLVTILFTAYQFIGANLPTKIPGPNSNLVAVVPQKTVPAKNSLQMIALNAVTITLFPTLAPPEPPPPDLYQLNSIDCGTILVGRSEPEMVWAYRAVATKASSNQPSIQAFYRDESTLQAGTTPMQRFPVDHNISPALTARRDGNKFPISPALFITNISSNLADTSGDARNGGVPQGASDIYGAWKREGGFDPPAPNGPNLGTAADRWPPANGPGGPHSQNWIAEIVWKIADLKTKDGQALITGNTYRIQQVIHDGDTNPGISELCYTVKL